MTRGWDLQISRFDRRWTPLFLKAMTQQLLARSQISHLSQVLFQGEYMSVPSSFTPWACSSQGHRHLWSQDAKGNTSWLFHLCTSSKPGVLGEPRGEAIGS